MTRSLNDLANELMALQVQIERGTEKAKKDAAMIAIEYATENTPVDTSRAISNWVVGIGQPVREYNEPHVAGRGGSSKAASVARAKQVARARLESQPAPIGVPIYVSNNAPYIQLLESGTLSKQGGHFAEGAASLAEAHLDRFDLRKG